MGFKQLSGAFSCSSLVSNGSRFTLQVRHNPPHKPSAGFPLQSGSRPATNLHHPDSSILIHNSSFKKRHFINVYFLHINPYLAVQI